MTSNVLTSFILWNLKRNTKRTAWRIVPCVKLWTVEVPLNPIKLEMLSGYLHGRWVCHSRIVCCLSRMDDKLEFLDSRVEIHQEFQECQILLFYVYMLGDYRESGKTLDWLVTPVFGRLHVLGYFSIIASLSVGLKTETIPRPTVTALSERPSLSRFVSLVHCTSTFIFDWITRTTSFPPIKCFNTSTTYPQQSARNSYPRSSLFERTHKN